jgi:hypothetical protein
MRSTSDYLDLAATFLSDAEQNERRQHAQAGHELAAAQVAATQAVASAIADLAAAVKNLHP